MEKIGFGILFFCLFFGLKSQKPEGVHKHMVRTMGTVGMGYGQDEWRYLIMGESGFFLSDKVEMNGAIHITAGTSNPNRLKNYAVGSTSNSNYTGGKIFMHSLFTGPKIHFTPNKPLDLYIGFQPGLSLVISTEYQGAESYTYIPKVYGLAPIVSECAGAAYYGSFFHLFAELRWIQGRFNSSYYSIPLGEIRGSFGLGFNIN